VKRLKLSESSPGLELHAGQPLGQGGAIGELGHVVRGDHPLLDQEVGERVALLVRRRVGRGHAGQGRGEQRGDGIAVQ
jgi:hypothetical protein